MRYDLWHRRGALSPPSAIWSLAFDPACGVLKRSRAGSHLMACLSWAMCRRRYREHFVGCFMHSCCLVELYHWKIWFFCMLKSRSCSAFVEERLEPLYQNWWCVWRWLIWVVLSKCLRWGPEAPACHVPRVLSRRWTDMPLSVGEFVESIVDFMLFIFGWYVPFWTLPAALIWADILTDWVYRTENWKSFEDKVEWADDSRCDIESWVVLQREELNKSLLQQHFVTISLLSFYYL